MDRIENVIGSFGGHQYRDCYKDLCQAISVGKEYLPNPPKMEEIAIEVSRRTKRTSPRAVWRSIARAVEDLWENGDLEALFSYYHSWRRYRPKPQEFVYIVARRIWEEDQLGVV